MAIGWHFLYEGWEKIDSFRKGLKPFTAEPYLRASQGPFRDWFERRISEDPTSLNRLSAGAVVNEARDDLNQLDAHYHFTPEQTKKAQKDLDDLAEEAEAYFNDPEVKQQLDDYKAGVKEIRDAEHQNLMEYQRDRLRDRAKQLEGIREGFVKNIDASLLKFHQRLMERLTKHQLELGPPGKPWTRLDLVNYTTAYGLTIVGALLLIGLFSRTACVAAACYLLLFYLSMPPWPGLPEPANVEGHYLFVNKNLIEMLALLALAATPSGRWAGLDAWIHGAIVRPLRARWRLRRSGDRRSTRRGVDA